MIGKVNAESFIMEPNRNIVSTLFSTNISWRLMHRTSLSILIYVMAWRLMAPNHHLNQYWLVTRKCCGTHLQPNSHMLTIRIATSLLNLTTSKWVKRTIVCTYDSPARWKFNEGVVTLDLLWTRPCSRITKYKRNYYVKITRTRLSIDA